MFNAITQESFKIPVLAAKTEGGETVLFLDDTSLGDISSALSTGSKIRTAHGYSIHPTSINIICLGVPRSGFFQFA